MSQSENGLDTKNEYKKAAKRHLDACRYMLDHLEEIKPADNYGKNNILMDIYYLSGYIIECASSFGMLCLGKKITWTDKNGKEQAIHNFQNNFVKPIDFTCESKGFKLNLQKKITESKASELYYEWRVGVRYKVEQSFDKETISEFVELSCTLCHLITNNEKKLIDIGTSQKRGK